MTEEFLNLEEISVPPITRQNAFLYLNYNEKEVNLNEYIYRTFNENIFIQKIKSEEKFNKVPKIVKNYTI
tara:strand:+ start:334 stop:543 length:210 start_codon:yes stop_codon:yes gene_type:complete